MTDVRDPGRAAVDEVRDLRDADALSTFAIERFLAPSHLAEALRADALAGLTATPKELPPKWFYDDAGCALFDEITRLPEYYPTRAEREILETRAGEIVSLCGADTLVELGSGTSEKTRLLLNAMAECGALKGFVPFDVAEGVLRDAGRAIAREYGGIAVHAVVGDFEHHLGRLPVTGRRLIAFLGSTIGNLRPPQRAELLGTLAAGMRSGDALLLGTDLVKDVARLEAAYDDAAGVTAAFNKNILAVLNRELGATFDLDAFDHVARFDLDEEWIEMLLRSRVAQTIVVPELGIEATFDAGEQMRTEISGKFRRERVEAELASAGLSMRRWWTDAAGDFALSLSTLA